MAASATMAATSTFFIVFSSVVVKVRDIRATRYHVATYVPKSRTASAECVETARPRLGRETKMAPKLVPAQALLISGLHDVSA